LLSIVVPTLDEGEQVADLVASLQGLRRRGHEVILIDGGSRDDTVAQATGHVDQLLASPRGRARQMNAGARVAQGDVLVFLHADTRLPPEADRLILEALADGRHAHGCFDLRLTGRRLPLRVVETAINLRSRLSRISTGDQTLFVTRRSFDRAGGFPEIPLMEDVALCQRLKRLGRPARARGRVITSSRRWEERGVVRTILLMWGLRSAFYLGVDAHLLARLYPPARGRKSAAGSPRAARSSAEARRG
jgi:rSAM/selenodomain-associated transferase 2